MNGERNMKKLLIAGGDLRQIYCGKYFLRDFDVYFMGFDTKYMSESLKIADLNENIVFDVIVFPVLPMKDDVYINTPFSDDKFSIEMLKKHIDSNTVIFCGKPDDKFKEFFNRNDIYDYMNREELNILNAVPTVEGAICIAIEEMPITLAESKILITGFGRIGKILANVLKGFGADITVMTKSLKNKAWAKAMNCNNCTKSEINSSYDLIFNTAPVLIFDEKTLKKLNPDTVLIDLASKPGGIDFKSAGDLGLKVIWALGLPGKTAPITSGEIIAETIAGILNERSDDRYD